MEKTGLEYELFMNFIKSLHMNYFKRGDRLIFNPEKIKQIKQDIKEKILQQSRTKDYITLSSRYYEIPESVIQELAQELYSDSRLEGIFYKEGTDTIFYTSKGIRELHN